MRVGVGTVEVVPVRTLVVSIVCSGAAAFVPPPYRGVLSGTAVVCTCLALGRTVRLRSEDRSVARTEHRFDAVVVAVTRLDRGVQLDLLCGPGSVRAWNRYGARVVDDTLEAGPVSVTVRGPQRVIARLGRWARDQRPVRVTVRYGDTGTPSTIRVTSGCVRATVRATPT